MPCAKPIYYSLATGNARRRLDRATSVVPWERTESHPDRHIIVAAARATHAPSFLWGPGNSKVREAGVCRYAGVVSV
eukprot:9503248-Pyramimonas_sp.AAC.1